MRPTLRSLSSKNPLWWVRSGFLLANLTFHWFKLIPIFSYQLRNGGEKMPLLLRRSRGNCWWENRFSSWSPLVEYSASGLWCPSLLFSLLRGQMCNICNSLHQTGTAEPRIWGRVRAHARFFKIQLCESEVLYHQLQRFLWQPHPSWTALLSGDLETTPVWERFSAQSSAPFWTSFLYLQVKEKWPASEGHLHYI